MKGIIVVNKTIKTLAILCAAAMLLTACSNSGSQVSQTTGQTTSETEEIVQTTATPQSETVVEETTAPVEEEKTGLSENGFSSPEMEEQYFAKSAELETLYAGICEEKDFPVINITTLDEAKILSKDEYVTSVIDVFNCDEEFVLSAEGGVKVRGNSTAEQGTEKPYRIKFTEKHNMLGLHDGNEYKSWVLLRSYWNLAPDYMAFNLAKEIFDGEYYCSDCTYVNLYLNGEYAGMYLLAEQNQAGKDRIDVYEPSKDETQVEIGYVLELDNYADEEHPHFTVVHGDTEFTDINGETRKFADEEYSVKSDTTSDEQLAFIEKYTSGVYEILWQAVQNNTPMMFDSDYNVVSAEGTCSTPEEAVSAVIDLDSLVNMLILEELVQNYDVGAGSFYMAVDFTAESKYEKLTFLAPWDFNWAFTEEPRKNFYACTFQKIMMDEDRSNPWLTTAMKADWLQTMVKEKWAELSADDALKKVTQQVADDVSLLENDLGEENAWSIGCAYQIVDYVNTRIKFLDTQWSE